MAPGGSFSKEIFESHIVPSEYDLATSGLELRSSPFRKAGPSLGGNMGIPSTNDVHELLDCPVCMNLMYPPIHQVYHCLGGNTSISCDVSLSLPGTFTLAVMQDLIK